MPETGSVGPGIRRHLRRWMGLYIAMSLAVCFLNHLVYTVTRPGFSDDERLKIMLLNAEGNPSDEVCAALLAQLQQADSGILSLEFEQLPPLIDGDAASEMLVMTKLTGGYGDIYLCDESALALLQKRQLQVQGGTIYLEKCKLTGEKAYLTVIANTTDMESAMAALPVLAEALKE